MALRHGLLRCLASSNSRHARSLPMSSRLTFNWNRYEWRSEQRNYLSTDTAKQHDTRAAAAAVNIDNIDNTDSSKPTMTPADSRKLIMDALWMQNYEKVKELLDEHGHNESDLPRFEHCKEPKKLARWLDMQRHSYRRKLEGLSNTISAEREEKLVALGVAMRPWDRHWDNRYHNLLAFMKERGCFPHECDRGSLDEEAKRLLIWCNKQRQQHHILKEAKQGQFSSMTPERESQLTSIGFSFNLFNEIWMERYDELHEYRQHHGDCLVPHKYEANPQLGIWIGEQRYNFKKFKEGRPSSMSQERFVLLNKLDFVWFVPDILWNERLGELKEYIAIHGPGSQPAWKENRKLRYWISAQNRINGKRLNGEKTLLTDERIKKLNEVGFQWTT